MAPRPASIPPRAVRARRRHLAIRLRDQTAERARASTEALRQLLAGEIETTKAELAAARKEGARLEEAS